MRRLLFLFFFLLFTFILTYAQDPPIALVGATIVDLSDFGNGTRDIPNSTVLIRNGRITGAGPSHLTSIPAGAKIIDVKGKFIVPGLIDGQGMIKNQAQANTYLFMGVTTICGGIKNDKVRGDMFISGNPTPHIVGIYSIPSNDWERTLDNQSALTREDTFQMLNQIMHLDSAKAKGNRIVFLNHHFPSKLLYKLKEKTDSLHLNTMGELHLTSYEKALKEGIQSFVHTQQYIFDAFPDSLQKNMFEKPNDTAINRAYLEYFYNMSIADNSALKVFRSHMILLHSALMPVLSMAYSSLPDHKNLWTEPAAAILDPKDISQSMDPVTGQNRSTITEQQGLRLLEIEKYLNIKRNMHYLAGSGAGEYGSMPGISMYTELELFTRIGLSPRQALATATGNYCIIDHWNNCGVVSSGAQADFLVLDADPTIDLSNLKKINRLYLDGKLVDRQALLKK